MKQNSTIMKFGLCLLMFLRCSAGWEIFFQNNRDEMVPMKNINQTFHIAIFQSRKIIVHVHPEALQKKSRFSESRIVAFRLEARSTVPHVIELEKQSSTGQEKNDTGTVLIEDLFLVKNKNSIAQVLNVYPSPNLNEMNGDVVHAVWILNAIKMEQTTLRFRLDLFHSNGKIISEERSISILITAPQRRIDRIFQIFLPILIVFISIQMGILLDTAVLIELVKKPKAVFIGFVAQYGLMPFLAMGIAKLFRYTPLDSLALFIIGCCPGSGASNQWTLLFDGDVNLSAVMSFVSTASSFFMMPVYFYTIGQMYMNELSINVPFFGLLRSLALVVFPYSLGIVISHFSKKTRAIVERLVKPMMLFLLLFFLIFGTIVNWYVFKMIELHIALTAPLLPYVGFIMGGVIAWIFRLEWSHVKTVGIEAGIQNIGIAFMIILNSFPQSYSAKALAVPLVVAFLTNKPFWVIYVIRSRIKKYQKEKKLKTSSANGHTELQQSEEKAIENDADLAQVM